MNNEKMALSATYSSAVGHRHTLESSAGAVFPQSGGGQGGDVGVHRLPVQLCRSVDLLLAGRMVEEQTALHHHGVDVGDTQDLEKQMSRFARTFSE